MVLRTQAQQARQAKRAEHTWITPAAARLGPQAKHAQQAKHTWKRLNIGKTGTAGTAGKAHLEAVYSGKVHIGQYCLAVATPK